LRHQRRLRVGHFDNLRLTGAISRDRCSQVVLRFSNTFARQSNSGRGARRLRSRGIKLLGKSFHRDRSFVLRNLHAQICLPLLAAGGPPVKDGNRQAYLR
jgi:hypothetical protein